MFKDQQPSTELEKWRKEFEPLFRYGSNDNLTLTSKGVDTQGRLWGRGILLAEGDQRIAVAGYLASVDSDKSQDLLGPMVFGWVITEINGQSLQDKKYLLANVVDVDPVDKKRILSEAAYQQAMRKLARKIKKVELRDVPPMNIYHYSNWQGGVLSF